MKKTETRIQKKNHSAIKAAGLKVFAQFGFRGATLDQIAAESGLSKPNILYYFASKEAIYEALLAQLLTDWLQPVRDIDPAGDPVEEILKYAKHKLKMSRLYPRGPLSTSDAADQADSVTLGGQRISNNN